MRSAPSRAQHHKLPSNTSLEGCTGTHITVTNPMLGQQGHGCLASTAAGSSQCTRAQEAGDAQWPH